MICVCNDGRVFPRFKDESNKVKIISINAKTYDKSKVYRYSDNKLVQYKIWRA